MDIHRSFQVNQYAFGLIFGRCPEFILIGNFAYRTTVSAPGRFYIRPNRVDVDVDLRAKIDLTHADQRTKAFELKVGVALCVANDDDFAFPFDQLISTQILKVPAIGN